MNFGSRSSQIMPFGVYASFLYPLKSVHLHDQYTRFGNSNTESA